MVKDANFRFPAYVLALVFASAVTYLPFVSQIGYMYDDWYLMYAAKAYGPRAFIDIFSVDRPARALVMIAAYVLFGEIPLYYNIAAYVWRVISAICFLWLLRMLWPHHSFRTFLASLLFLIYPGFLSQINGIDYQSQMLSLALAMFSIAISVRISTESLLSRRFFFLFLLAVISGWVYLALVEYFIGLEYLRLASLLILSFRNPGKWKAQVIDGLKRWLPNAVIPGVFLTWRVFFFTSERTATSIPGQLSRLLHSPLSTLFSWGLKTLTESLDVLLLAWGLPFSQLHSILPPLYILVVFLLSALLILGLYRFSLSLNIDLEEEKQRYDEMALLGGSTIVAGLLPIIIVNREVDFVNFSRYALASSTGVSLLVVFWVFSLKRSSLRWLTIFVLVLLSLWTHYANAFRAALWTKDIQEFWWQVSWRVPGIKEGTTLVANYSLSKIPEDYVVWGAANLIYYPHPVSSGKLMHPPLYAFIYTDTGVRNRILAGGTQEYRRKKIVVYPNANTLLVLSRPSRQSCVHLIDGKNLEFSANEVTGVMVIAPYSRLDRVLLEAPEHIPPTAVFGKEPPHDWCFFYEKADLARQRRDWDEVWRLGEQALQNGLAPGDPIEWMPFLQAYAQKGESIRLQEIREKIGDVDPWVMLQICQRLTKMALPPQTSSLVQQLYCAP